MKISQIFLNIQIIQNKFKKNSRNIPKMIQIFMKIHEKYHKNSRNDQ